MSTIEKHSFITRMTQEEFDELPNKAYDGGKFDLSKKVRSKLYDEQ